MERTLVILKPCDVQRALMGEIISRLERKGLTLVGMKMVQLTDEKLDEHYAHLKEKPFFPILKEAMSKCPSVVCCCEGVEAIKVVRMLVGLTNGREAAPGTIRGDFCMSMQENIIHASDSIETAAIEIKRFFNDNELFDYEMKSQPNLYSVNEMK